MGVFFYFLIFYRLRCKTFFIPSFIDERICGSLSTWKIDGVTDKIIITIIIGKRYLSISGIVLPKKYPKPERPTVHKNPPTILYATNFPYCICPTPANIGAKVRIIGIKRAKIIVLPP